MEYYSSEGEAFEFCGSSLAEEQNFTNIYQEKLTIKQNNIQSCLALGQAQH